MNSNSSKIIALAAGMFALLVVTLFAAPQDARSVDKPFDLKAGATASIENGNLTIALDRVTADSRCPTNVTCFWEGDATVVLTLQQKDSKEPSTAEIHTSGRFATEIVAGNYRIKLQALKPYPNSDVKIDPKAYVATLLVSAAGSK